jgi:hypothetical protein
MLVLRDPLAVGALEGGLLIPLVTPTLLFAPVQDVQAEFRSKPPLPPVGPVPLPGNDERFEARLCNDNDPFGLNSLNTNANGNDTFASQWANDFGSGGTGNNANTNNLTGDMLPNIESNM